MESQLPKIDNVNVILSAHKIVGDVLEKCKGDSELLLAVYRQLGGILGPAVTPPVSNAPIQSQKGTSRGRKGGSRGTSKESKGKSPQIPPKKISGGGSPGKAEVPTPQSSNPSTPHSGRKTPATDESGITRSTWKTRIRTSRQKCLEDWASLKIQWNEKAAAIFCNSYKTLTEQVERYKANGLASSNEADPFRDLPSLSVFIDIFGELEKSSDWKLNDKNHFIIQTSEGKTLRGTQLFSRIADK